MGESTVLVTGGCGFVGYHVVRALLEDRTWTDIHVVSRNPAKNRQEGVHYHAGDIVSSDQMEQIMAKIEPNVIIHTASPVSAGNDADERSFMETNVNGTRNLLSTAASTGTVKAFVFTSSSSVMKGTSFVNTKEDAPVIEETTRGVNFYSKSKAVADRLVLNANVRTGMRTVSLRIASVYGERDNQLIPGTLDALQHGLHKTQIGDNKNLFDFVSCENVAHAHLLAAKALTVSYNSTELNVDGEAFLITDDDAIPFWDFERKVWAAAGDDTPLRDVRIIPSWFMLALASTVEWIYWIFTLGRKRPKTLRRHNMEYATKFRTFNIDKAKERLGYLPNASKRDEHIKQGVVWALREKEQRCRLKQQ